MSGYVKAGQTFLKNLLKGGKQKTTGTGAITSVPPSVGNKSLSKLKIQVQKTKASAAKLRQTISESQTGEYKKSGFTFAHDRGNVSKKSKKKD